MKVIARVVRIQSDPTRGVLYAFCFPFVLLGWLWTVLKNDPKQLFTSRPYAIAFAMFLAGVDGHFV